jgi:hypothetical protein
MKQERTAWEKERKTAESTLEVHELMSMYDTDAQRRRGSVLLAAEGMLTDGLRMLTVGLTSNGASCLEQAVALALAAIEDGDRGPYRGEDEGYAFAKYVAFRVIYLSRWATEVPYLNDYSQMVQNLEQAFGVSYRDGVKSTAVSAEPIPLTHLILHYCEESNWQRAARLASIGTGPSGRAVWDSLRRILETLAIEKVSSGDTKVSGNATDVWFRARLKAGEPDRLFDPELRWVDIVACARVRAVSIVGDESPEMVIASIHDPDVNTLGHAM